ncbi:hypothetical protein OF83DRAFT_1120423 [Amylostereum chailletii]|nr:hypothetical protein OF83DRAFT_1120423 [Amylostereum chailletii]
MIQRKIIITTNKKGDVSLASYRTELEKVVGHPAVKATLSSLEQEIAKNFGSHGKDGNFDNVEIDNIKPMAQKLTKIVEKNLLDESDVE